MIDGGLLIEFGDGRDPIEMRFSLSDKSVELLQGYLREVQSLSGSLSRIRHLGASLEFSGKQASGFQIRMTEPASDDLAILLHRLRPLILQDEPYAFHRACAEISKSTEDVHLRKHIKHLRNQFYCKPFEKSISIKHGTTELTSEAGFQHWLNGFEYHRVKDRANAISSETDILSVAQLRPLFVMMLDLKINTILALGDLASKMLAPPSG